MRVFLNVLFRWLHIVPAAILIGGVFVMQIVVPVGLKALEPDVREAVLLRWRRVFKMTVHSCILLLLISGTYNTIGNWPAYAERLPLSHAFWGPHVILALVAMGLLFYVLAGHTLRPRHGQWMATILVVLLLAVLFADITKWVREHVQPNTNQVNRAAVK